MKINQIGWDMLLRRVGGTLSPDEESIFQEWLMQDERHGEYYERIRRIWSADTTTHDLNTDISKMIGGFDDFVQKEREMKRKKVVRNLYRYAACLLLVLVIGGGFLFLNKESWSTSMQNKVAKATLPGEKKVVILLSDGKKVDVEMLVDTMLYKTEGIEILKNSGVIKYSTSLQSDTSYNTILIPKGGEYQVELGDGTKVWLNSDTKLMIPTIFTGNERRVFLSGEAYFSVSKDGRKPFVVETDLGDVKVYGTEFNVKFYPNEKQLKATLIEGVISFRSDKVDEFKIKPGYQINFMEGSEYPQIREVKVYNEIAWRNKQFNFENKSLQEIAWDLERWYDVEIVFADPMLKDLVFSGTLNRYGEIETLLALFEEGVDVKFVIENNIIEVMKR